MNGRNTEDVFNIKNKAFLGFKNTIIAKIAIKFITTISTAALANILMPDVFGVYSVVTFIISIFISFQDFGFGASLVQKRDKPTLTDLRTVFTIQLIFVSIFTLIIYLIAPLMEVYYAKPLITELIRAQSITLFVTSLGSISSSLLERDLNFGKLIIPEILGTISYYGIAIIFSLQGFTIWGLIIASISTSILRTILLIYLSPWKIGLALNKNSATQLMNFGLNVQATNVIGYISASLIPIYVGYINGMNDVGYLTWAHTVGLIPLGIVLLAGRITFPAYSRIQHDNILLKKAIEKTIQFMAFLVIPAILIMFSLAPMIINYVYSDKWMPALFALYLYLMNSLIGGIWGNLFGSVLWAKGKSNMLFKISIIRMIFTWVLGVPLIWFIGFTGVALAELIMSIFVIPLMYFIIKKYVTFDFWIYVLKPLISAGIVGILIIYLNYLVTDLISLLIFAMIGGLLYLLILIAMGEKTIIVEFIKTINKISQTRSD